MYYYLDHLPIVVYNKKTGVPLFIVYPVKGDDLSDIVQWMELPFVQGDWTKERFDLAVAFDVVEHLPSPEIGIRNTYKLLRKGGFVVFTTPNNYPHVSNDPTHISVKPPEQWEELLKRVGFRNIIIKQITLVPYFYRWYWKFAFVFPFAVESRYVISPVIIIAKK